MLKLLFPLLAFANPYPDPAKVPPDSSYPPPHRLPLQKGLERIQGRRLLGLDTLRVTVKVDQKEKYSLAALTRETSGTEGLLARARHESKRGSYRARLIAASGAVIGNDDIGIGKEYRKLTDALTFRFPFPSGPSTLEVTAENPETGVMEKVLTVPVANIQTQPSAPAGLEIRELLKPTQPGAEIRLVFYADGYRSERREQFFADAQKGVATLRDNKFPLAERMHFFAVFAPSAETLGDAEDPGLPVKEKNSFLGLYFPYWDKFDRWYNVVYPTSEKKFRDSLGLAPYDYPVALVDDGAYWGVGNYRELTAIPARSSMFTYLFLHEFGHFMSLNEEYEGGGPTELEFAPGIEEPWSPNITFLRQPDRLKWKSFVKSGTPIPTSSSYWNSNPPNYGAYKGGYGDSDRAHSHKPGFQCVMESGSAFCSVCKAALSAVVKFDAGQ